MSEVFENYIIGKIERLEAENKDLRMENEELKKLFEAHGRIFEVLKKRARLTTSGKFIDIGYIGPEDSAYNALCTFLNLREEDEDDA